MIDMKRIEAEADPQGLRDQWYAKQAKKYRDDERIYRTEAARYKRARSRWGQGQFAKYTRMADVAQAKAESYERQDAAAMATIERDDAAVDGVLR